MAREKRRSRSADECKLYDVNSEKLYSAWLRSPDGSSNEVGLLLMQIADRALGSPSFRGYPFSVREELRSEMLLKMVKSWKNLNPEKPSSFFGYLYMACGSIAINWLKKHYRHENLRRLCMDFAFGRRTDQERQNPPAGEE